MSQNLLNQALSGKVAVCALRRWFLENEAKQYKEFPCSRGEFIAFLLNFIHEEALCFEKYRETPKKIHTPKSIRKLEISSKPRRRPALFTDSPSVTTSNTIYAEGRRDRRETIPLSPISPLYSTLNVLPGDNLPVVMTPKSKNFCLGDFISPNRKSTGRDRKLSLSTPTSSGGDPRKTRRINPTNVAQRKSINTENTFNFKSNVAEEEEAFLREGRNFPISESKLNPKPQQKEIPSNLDLVTKKEHLETLITLYVELINNNLVLNVTSELYFIITLLFCKQYDSDYFPSPIFASIHNVVYFAVKSLREINLEHSLLFDNSTLRLLDRNERLQSLPPDDAYLHLKFALLLNESNNIEESPRECEATPEKIVCFDSDTDNRMNFPSDASFHAFRKQRDMFYEILHAWETNHTTDGWNFAAGLGGKVKSLIGMHSDPSNFRHLSRLIKSQLLISCSGIQHESLPENQLTFLKTLPNLSSDKLNRLKSRLAVKDQSTSINASPAFPGSQEFYRELVAQAATHIFCTHLRNVFIQDLLQLNETTFDTITEETYCRVVKSSQLLAKFIGYIDAMPYKPLTNTLQNDKMTLEEVESRSWMSPPIDLHQKLTSAMDNGQLVLLIPWLVEYLAMLDGTSLRLPYFEAIFSKLFAIFSRMSFARNELGMSNGNSQLIMCCLGWLFEQQHFPSENYFHFLNISSEQREFQMDVKSEAIDKMQIINITTLYTICPFLKEFKKLLQYNCNHNGSITSKHITPVTAVETLNTEISVGERRLKLHLQEAFLNSKPSSLRKTLEFVSERVASCIVKTICNQILPAVKTQVTNEKKTLFSTHANENHDMAFKLDVKVKLSKIIASNLKQLRMESEQTSRKQIEAKIFPGVRALLCDDELDDTVAVCAEIARRMCEERVKQWIDTRVNASVFKEFDVDVDRVETLLQKERDESVRKKFKSLPTQGRSNVDHIESDDETRPESSPQSAIKLMNPSKLLTLVQRHCSNLLKYSRFLPSPYHHSEENVRNLLQHVVKCHQHRSDLSDIAWHQLNLHLVDYYILICTKSAGSLNEALLNDFVTFWKGNKEPYLTDIFKGVVSVRNTMILMTAPLHDRRVTWEYYSGLLSSLLHAELLSPDDFESQCLAVFRENWDAATLECFCQCLKAVVDEHAAKDLFGFLVRFLSEFCVDLDENC